MSKIIGGIGAGGKIESPTAFEFRAFGNLPPGIPQASIEPWALACFNVSATILPRLTGVYVVVHEVSAEELVRAYRESMKQ
jgi:hypothetical protein